MFTRMYMNNFLQKKWLKSIIQSFLITIQSYIIDNFDKYCSLTGFMISAFIYQQKQQNLFMLCYDMFINEDDNGRLL